MALRKFRRKFSTEQRLSILKQRLSILTELKRRLNGKCGECYKSCPSSIPPYLWKCRDCVIMFRRYVNLEPKKTKYTNPCPCHYAPDIALTVLDEEIERLQSIFRKKHLELINRQFTL